jgi:hypothetical protein
MDDLTSMKARVAYLKRQADDFRKLADLSHDGPTRAQLIELAERCEAIAANISRNIPIHERFRESDHP